MESHAAFVWVWVVVCSRCWCAQDIKEDVEEECKKFGTVTSVAIPKPGEVGCGKVFVEFSDTQGSQTAAAALNNRKFGDNTVVTEYFDEAKFTSGNFQ